MPVVDRMGTLAVKYDPENNTLRLNKDIAREILDKLSYCIEEAEDHGMNQSLLLYLNNFHLEIIVSPHQIAD